MKKFTIMALILLLIIGASTFVFANANNFLTEEEIKNIAIKFSESSLSDFSDGSADYLIDKRAVHLKQFLKDKRAIKTIKEDRLGRKLSLIHLKIKDIKLKEFYNCYGVTMTVTVNFSDGNMKSNLEYFNAVVIDKETGLIIAASTNDLSAGTLLNNQDIHSANDLLELNDYENESSSVKIFEKNNIYDFDEIVKNFESYVKEIKNEQSEEIQVAREYQGKRHCSASNSKINIAGYYY